MRLLISLCCFIAFNVAGANQFTLYFSRHAEKVESASQDPGLTEQGKKRAKNLAKFLADKNIKAVYSTDYQRTEQTAKPVAEQLELPIIVYNDEELPALAAMLTEQRQDALVVGHSNTTPLLVHLTGGDAESIDESRYGDLFAVTFKSQSITTEKLAVAPQQDISVSSIPVVPSRFTSGKSRYRILLDGQEAGYAIEDLIVKNGQLELTKITMLEEQNINTIVKLWAQTDSLKPLQVSMSGAINKPVDIQLNFADNHVTGYSDMTRQAFQQQGKLTIDRWLPANSYERATILGGIQAIDYSTRPLYFNWFNGQNDELKVISIQKTGEVKISVPAGEFDCDVVSVTGGAPSSVYYISKADFKVIKIEIPAINRVYERVE
ncbi:SixA phosphatase family protein [Neptunicella sp. SCSIO 80796]|uniref:SixA phosphatase family protein n=1 Tax=Neptunicella plasticusilytica TaxID=3117012 RepID=UPI003A4D72ED